MLSYLVKQVLLPPISLIALLALALTMPESRRVWSRRIAVLCLVVVLSLSTKLVSATLAGLVERVPPVTTAQATQFGADCIVILGAGVILDAAEYNGVATPSSQTLMRLNYGFFLARSTKVPVLVSGGLGDTPEENEAAVMAKTLDLWGLKEVVQEGQSENTDQNAKFSAKILQARQAHKVILVTSASHMPRALRSFSDQGLEVLPAPTGFYDESRWDHGLTAWFPTYRYLDSSCESLQALVGEGWYRLKG